MIDAKTLRTLARCMRKEGILRVKTADIELEMSPISMFHGEPSRKKPVKNEPEERIDTPQYTEIDALLWSSPGLTEEELN